MSSTDPTPWLLEHATYASIRDAHHAVAVLPWGATEAHNLHLPYGTDTIETAFVATESARLACQRGARVIALPTVPFGVHTAQLDIPLCLNVNPSTQMLVLRDLLESVDRAEIPRLVVINGHGGNDFKQMIRELQPATRVLLCTLNWYSCVDAHPYFDEPGDHAGELETSAMLHIAQHLVASLDSAGPGTARPFAVDAFHGGWAWTPRQWTRVTDDTGVGNPRAATAERGARFLHAVTERIAGFLVELARTPLDAMYQGERGTSE